MHVFGFQEDYMYENTFLLSEYLQYIKIMIVYNVKSYLIRENLTRPIDLKNNFYLKDKFLSNILMVNKTI